MAPLGIRANLPGDAEDPPPLETALAAYRRVTRGYFAEGGFRALREALPTLCMWDDHEIFNNWGSLRTESLLDQRLFAAASLVYRDYQHARNPAGGTGRPAYDYVFRFGTTGFLVLDVRGARSYEDGRILGTAQWDRVLAFLRGPQAADLHTLFVVVSVPVAHAARWFALLLDWIPGEQANDVRDRWVSSAFRASRDEFLDAFLRWEAEAPHRQVDLPLRRHPPGRRRPDPPPRRPRRALAVHQQRPHHPAAAEAAMVQLARHAGAEPPRTPRPRRPPLRRHPQQLRPRPPHAPARGRPPDRVHRPRLGPAAAGAGRRRGDHDESAGDAVVAIRVTATATSRQASANRCRGTPRSIVIWWTRTTELRTR